MQVPKGKKFEKVDVNFKSWLLGAYIFFRFFTRWYVPKIEICLKYYLDTKFPKAAIVETTYYIFLKFYSNSAPIAWSLSGA